VVTSLSNSDWVSLGSSGELVVPLSSRQIAARELELVRIKGALQRAEELNDDVAAAIDGTF
jgi:hypothetical protein